MASTAHERFKKRITPDQSRITISSKLILKSIILQTPSCKPCNVPFRYFKQSIKILNTDERSRDQLNAASFVPVKKIESILKTIKNKI